MLEPLAEWFERVFMEVMEELKVPLSSTEEHFSACFEAIGAEFRLDGGRLRVGPTKETLVDFEALLGKVAAEAAAAPLTALGAVGTASMALMDSYIGTAQWVAHFFDDAHARCRPALQCRRRARRKRGKHASTVDVTSAALDAGRALLEDSRSGFDRNLFRKPTRSPVWTHAGMRIAADASTTWGWGLHVGNWFAAGPWEPATLRAIARSRAKAGDERVSISPLELATQTGLAALAAERYGAALGGQVVLRCDNKSSCDVVASRRPRSAAMRAALLLLEQVEAHYRIKVWLEHVPTGDNTIADALSKNAAAAASASCTALGWGAPVKRPDGALTFAWGGERVTLEQFMSKAEQLVRTALSAEDVELAA